MWHGVARRGGCCPVRIAFIIALPASRHPSHQAGLLLCQPAFRRRLQDVIQLTLAWAVLLPAATAVLMWMGVWVHQCTLKGPHGHQAQRSPFSFAADLSPMRCYALCFLQFPIVAHACHRYGRCSWCQPLGAWNTHIFFGLPCGVVTLSSLLARCIWIQLQTLPLSLLILSATCALSHALFPWSRPHDASPQQHMLHPLHTLGGIEVACILRAINRTKRVTAGDGRGARSVPRRRVGLQLVLPCVAALRLLRHRATALLRCSRSG